MSKLVCKNSCYYQIIFHFQNVKASQRQNVTFTTTKIQSYASSMTRADYMIASP